MRYLTQLKPAGTNSYRLSASQLFDFGGNAQNNSKGTMDIFEAPEGWSFVQRDQSGAESLIVAYECRPGRYRNLFIHGVKPHTYVALHLFLDKFRGNHPRSRYWLQDPKVLRTFEEWAHIASVIKNTTEYDIGKKTGHGANYCMGPNTFREFTLKESEGSLILDMAQAQYYLGTYKELFPEIVELQQELIARVKKDRRLVNKLGFPRRFERPFTESYTREIVSWIPQSTVGCITHNAVEFTCNHIRKERLPWRFVSNKHDSYALLVPDNHIDEAGAVMKRHLNITLQGVDAPFTMASDFQVGKNLKKFSKDNPQGMLER